MSTDPTKMGGASSISPSPVGGRRRGTRKMSKKVKAMLKKMKLMGGDPMQIEGNEHDMDEDEGGGGLRALQLCDDGGEERREFTDVLTKTHK